MLATALDLNSAYSDGTLTADELMAFIEARSHRDGECLVWDGGVKRRVRTGGVEERVPITVSTVRGPDSQLLLRSAVQKVVNGKCPHRGTSGYLIVTCGIERCLAPKHIECIEDVA